MESFFFFNSNICVYWAEWMQLNNVKEIMREDVLSLQAINVASRNVLHFI